MITMHNELLVKYKETQREGWGAFAPLEIMTTLTAPTLVKFSQLQKGDVVLDVGCGTGVVAITAARLGAIVSGIDLSPQLIQHANRNKQIAGLEIDFKEGDVEILPYTDNYFDVVLSQFGHMFAPRAQVAIDEMLRVLKPGGIIAFSTWPPEHFMGSLFNLINKYNPPALKIDPPSQWGTPEIIRNRLGGKVNNLFFDYGLMLMPALSLEHYQHAIEKTIGPIVKFVEQQKDNSIELQNFRSELKELASNYYQDNKIHQSYLLTRAMKNN